MAGRLVGKTAIVTSAVQGIGRATALAMAREGAKVYATDIREDLLRALEKEQAGIEALVLDVPKQDQVDAAVKCVEIPDILFNRSGHVHAGTVLETDDKARNFSFDLNVKARLRMAKAFMPSWLTCGKGAIVNMASAASSIRGAPNRFVYGATKALHRLPAHGPHGGCLGNRQPRGLPCER